MAKAKRSLALLCPVLLAVALILPCFAGIVGASAVFPLDGTIFRDFEDGVDSVDPNYLVGLQAESSTQHVASGEKSVMISPKNGEAASYDRIYVNLGNGLGAEGSDALNTKFVGFYLKAPKGQINGDFDTENPTVLLQDIEMSGGGEYYSYKTGAKYWLMADGTDEWVEKAIQGTSIVLPSEFSGYVMLDINGFNDSGDKKATPENIFEQQWQTFLRFYFNKIGGEFGNAYVDAFFYATKDITAKPEAKEFPIDGTIFRDFEDGVDSVDPNYLVGLQAESSTQYVASGDKSVMISPKNGEATSYDRIYVNLGNGLGAEGSDALKAKFVGFYLKAPKGQINGDFDTENPTVLLQDIEMSGGGEYYSYKTGAKYWLMADGTDEWVEKAIQGSSMVLPSEFSGYVLIDINGFNDSGDKKATPENIFEQQWQTFLRFYFNKIGGEFGNAYVDAFFYATKDIVAEAGAKKFPIDGTIFRDFEDGVDSVDPNYLVGLQAESSTKHVASGEKSVMISPKNGEAASYDRIYVNLGNGLGAEGSDALKAKFVGFYLKAPKGQINGDFDTENPTVLLQDIEMSGGGEYYSYKTGAKYWLMADGTDEWVEKAIKGTSIVLPSEFSGYVMLDINGFNDSGDKKATPENIFEQQWQTFLRFYFNKIGGDFGNAYVDAFFYSTKDIVTAPFAMGTLFDDFENGVGNVTVGYDDMTVSSSNDHASYGQNSVQISAAEKKTYAKVIFNLGANLGAEGSDALNMKYFGFHIAGLKGDNNDIKAGYVVLQDIKVGNSGFHRPDSTFWLMADGTTEWIEEFSVSSGAPIPSEFSGYVVFDVARFGVDSVEEMLKETGDTELSFFFNFLGGDLGSAYIDTLFYSTDPTFVPKKEEEDTRPSFEDVDEPAYTVDSSVVADINGTLKNPTSQTVYMLQDFEKESDINMVYPTAVNQLKSEWSMLHTGSGSHSLKLSSKYELGWMNAVPYMNIGSALGAEGSPSTQMTFVGFHIQTPKTDWFLLQDLQLSSVGNWFSLTGASEVYVMQDGADAWVVADRDATSIRLPGNWSGFVVLPVSGFINEEGVCDPAQHFSNKWETLLQMHFNITGYLAESVYLDTIFYSTSTAWQKDATQLVDVDGNYVAGKSGSPENDVLTSTATSEKVLDIDGYRIFARENTVADFKAMLKVPDGMSIVITKGDENAADSDQIAVGMVINVFDDNGAVAAYVIADVRAKPVPTRDFILTQKIDDETSPVIIDGQNITSQGFTVGVLFADYLNVSYGAQADVYDGETKLTADQTIKTGMVIRVYDPEDPALYNEYLLADVEEIDITNGVELTVKDGGNAKVEGDVVKVVEGTTVGQLIAMLEGPVNLTGMVIDADGRSVADDAEITEDMVFILVNDVYDEMARWNIAVVADDNSGDSGDSGEEKPVVKPGDVTTGVVVPFAGLGLLLASASVAFVTRKKH